MKVLPHLCVHVSDECVYCICVVKLNTLRVNVNVYSLTPHNTESIDMATVSQRVLAGHQYYYEVRT